MAIKKYKPTTPGRRFATQVDRKDLSKVEPEKSLVEGISKRGGRNNMGRITTRHIGGGHKRRYRIIDFKRNKEGVRGRVKTIEYDPNRSANIALISYIDGEKRYILAPKGLKIGQEIHAGTDADITVGNSLPLSSIPVGTVIHNVEINPGQGGKLARSAGSSIQLVAKEGDWAQLKMPSSEMRMVPSSCKASIGEVGNSEHSTISLGKAGRKRWMGVRPTVRGTAMNPVDHPHGGGEGKSKGNILQTPWGVPTIGKRTRKKKTTDNLIIRRRKK